MENVKLGFLNKIDPRNFNFTSKILVLSLGIVLLIILLFFTLGLRTLSGTLIRESRSMLEELTYVKTSALEMRLKGIEENLSEMSDLEQVESAGEAFISAFTSLSQDKYDLFNKDQLKVLTQQLTEFYTGAVADQSPLSADNIMDYVPSDARSIVSQYLFIYENPKPIGQKEAYSKYTDYSSYSQTHGSYHSYLNELRKKIDASDLYLVDPKSGYVVYSAQKNTDFGVNLFESELKDSKLAEAFHVAISSGKNKVFMSDYANYMPAGDDPVAFVSVPVYTNSQVAAILIVQYGTDILESLLYDDSLPGDESTLEFTVIGSDLKLRNSPKPFLVESANFIKEFTKLKGREESKVIAQYSKIGNMAMLVKYSIVYKNLLLSEGNIQFKDYLDKKVLASSKRLELNNHDDLFLVSKIDRREVVQPFRNQLRLYFLFALIILYVSFLVVRAVGRSFTQRLKRLFEGIHLLHSGEKVKDIESETRDELGDTINAYNKLRKRINNAEEFALEMSDGNYNYNFDLLSERDGLGKSLNVLKDTLIQSRDEHEARTREDEIRNWVNDGIAKFNDLLRKNTNDIKLLGYSLIENLVHYLDSSVGGIFLVEGDKESEKSIELLAGYAYDRRKYHKKTLEIGEGLLGACYLEKKPIFLKQIPDDYIEITSGLGHEVPKCLYIVPLMIDENVIGMIEIASFNEFTEHQIEFINRVADSIAGTFVSVRLNMRTTTLLEESNRRAEEISQQEEEMRQNMEEMQATQEELARLRQDDEKRTREMQLVIDNSRGLLKNLLDAIPGGYILKDPNGVIHLANTEGAEYYGLSSERIIGKTDHELLGSKIYQAEHKMDLEVLDQGEKKYTEEREIKGKKVKYSVVKKPFEIAGINQMGVLTIRNKA